jgi:hypothetical protein
LEQSKTKGKKRDRLKDEKKSKNVAAPCFDQGTFGLSLQGECSCAYEPDFLRHKSDIERLEYSDSLKPTALPLRQAA